MDHLPSPRNPFNPLGPIPCLVPIRKGRPVSPTFDLLTQVGSQPVGQEFAKCLLETTNNADFKAILSSWQYYRFFEAYSVFFNSLGVAVSSEDLVHEEEIDGVKQAFITTRTLRPHTAQLWAKHFNIGDDTSEASTLISNVSSEMSKQQVSWFCSLDLNEDQIRKHEQSLVDSSTTTQSLFDQIHISTSFLFNGLLRALQQVGENLHPEWTSESQLVRGGTQCLVERLLEAGWCPSEVCVLKSDSSIEIEELYYWSLRDRRASKYGRDHRSCREDERCRKENIDEATYTTVHCTDCDRQYCHMAFSEPTVSKLVSQGRIPLIITEGSQVKVLDTGKTFNEMKPSTENPVYVAISHVWSDGLGNPRENAIPQCQLQRLQRLANSLFPRSPNSTDSVPFWLDTLCVPVEKKARKAAIGAMGIVYSCATKALVLDDTLAEVAVDESDDAELRMPDAAELCMAIRSSTWAKRLWTFSESCLARDVYFQFGDVAANMIAIIGSAFRDAERSPESNVVPHHTDCRLINWITWWSLIKACDMTYMNLNKGQELYTNLLEALYSRRTSKLEDETICLASILGMDPSPILEHDSAEDRMHAFLKMLPSVPAGLLFDSRQRSQQEGRRWMPLTFLGGEPGTEDRRISYCSSGPATVSSDGLIVTKGGLLLQANVFDFWVSCRTRIEHNGHTYVVQHPVLADDASRLLSTCKLAIILQHALRPMPRAFEGVLVTILESSDAQLIVKLEMIVQLIAHEALRDRFSFEMPYVYGEGAPVIKTTPLPPNQEWLVR